jgi:hypothetical protein
MVTRNTSRLRKTLQAGNSQGVPRVSVASPSAAAAQAVSEPFDLALATTSTNPSYLRDISRLATHRNGTRVLDYCAAPLLPRLTPGHSHISDQEILAPIIEANESVEQRARLAEAWIDSVTCAAGTS